MYFNLICNLQRRRLQVPYHFIALCAGQPTPLPKPTARGSYGAGLQFGFLRLVHHFDDPAYQAALVFSITPMGAAGFGTCSSEAKALFRVTAFVGFFHKGLVNFNGRLEIINEAAGIGNAVQLSARFAGVAGAKQMFRRRGVWLLFHGVWFKAIVSAALGGAHHGRWLLVWVVENPHLRLLTVHHDFPYPHASGVSSR